MNGRATDGTPRAFERSGKATAKKGLGRYASVAKKVRSKTLRRASVFSGLRGPKILLWIGRIRTACQFLALLRSSFDCSTR